MQNPQLKITWTKVSWLHLSLKRWAGRCVYCHFQWEVQEERERQFRRQKLRKEISTQGLWTPGGICEGFVAGGPQGFPTPRILLNWLMGLLLLQPENHAVLVAAILLPQYLDSDPVYSLPADPGSRRISGLENWQALHLIWRKTKW